MQDKLWYYGLPFFLTAALIPSAQAGTLVYKDPNHRFVVIKNEGQKLETGQNLCFYAQDALQLTCSAVVLAKGQYVAIKLEPDAVEKTFVGMQTELKPLYVKEANPKDPAKARFVEVSKLKKQVESKKAKLKAAGKDPATEAAAAADGAQEEASANGAANGAAAAGAQADGKVGAIPDKDLKKVLANIFGPAKGLAEFQASMEGKGEAPLGSNGQATKETIYVEAKEKPQSLRIDLPYYHFLVYPMRYQRLKFQTVTPDVSSQESLWQDAGGNPSAAKSIGMRLQWTFFYKYLLLVDGLYSNQTKLTSNALYDPQVSDYFASVTQSFSFAQASIGLGRKFRFFPWLYASASGGLSYDYNILKFNAARLGYDGNTEEIIAQGDYELKQVSLHLRPEATLAFMDMTLSLGIDLSRSLRILSQQFNGEIVEPIGVEVEQDLNADFVGKAAFRPNTFGVAIYLAFGFEPY